MEKIKILIADDHNIVRQGLRTLFQSVPEFSIIGEAANGEELLHLAARHQPDLVIADLSMPALNGAEATRRLKENNPGAKVLILTIHDEGEYVSQLIRAGADGYVLKDADKDELFTAVRTIAAGGRFFGEKILKYLIDDFVKLSHEQGSAARSTKPRLTKRETEILRYVAEGLSSKAIAQRLFLSVRTVDTHRANIMEKLNIHETAGLVRYAIQKGIVEAKV